MIRRILPKTGLRICALPHDHGLGHRKPTPRYREDSIVTREAHSIAHVALGQCPKKVKSGLIAAIAAAAMVLAPTVAEAQNVSGSARASYSLEEQTVMPRLGLKYGLPGGASGLSWIDLRDGKYFGKTILTRTLGYGISARAINVHNNEPYSFTTLGVDVRVPGLPEGTKMTLGIAPVWVNSAGVMEGMGNIDYVANQQLPLGITVSSYGGLRFNENGQTWLDGEVNVTKTFGNFTGGYNGSTLSQGPGNPTPSLENRLSVSVSFK
jgi:hypothetical protein